MGLLAGDFSGLGFSMFSSFAGEADPDERPSWQPPLFDVREKPHERTEIPGDEPEEHPFRFAHAHLSLELTGTLLAMRKTLHDPESNLSEEVRADQEAFLRGMQQQLILELENFIGFHLNRQDEDGKKSQEFLRRALTHLRDDEVAEGLEQIKNYLQVLEGADQRKVHRQAALAFYCILSDQQLRKFMFELREYILPYHYDVRIETSKGSSVPPPRNEPSPTDQREKLFNSKGRLYVKYHVVQAIGLDFIEIIDDNRSYGSLNLILSGLHTSLAPVYTPDLTSKDQVRDALTALLAHTATSWQGFVDLRILSQGGVY